MVQLHGNEDEAYIRRVKKETGLPVIKALLLGETPDEDSLRTMRFEEPDCETLPVGCVLTMVGTGSEMNAGAVITNTDRKLKICKEFKDEKIMYLTGVENIRDVLPFPRTPKNAEF